MDSSDALDWVKLILGAIITGIGVWFGQNEWIILAGSLIIASSNISIEFNFHKKSKKGKSKKKKR